VNHFPEAIARMGEMKTGMGGRLPGLIPQKTTRRSGARISLIMFSPAQYLKGNYKGLKMRCL
jgi:hypothetical protein